MKYISFEQNNNNLLKSRKASPSFRSYAVAPKQIITDSTLKIVGLATSATGIANIAIQKKAKKKEELPTLEEFMNSVEEMKITKNKEITPRFSDTNFLKTAYESNPKLTLRYVEMKDKNGKWIINSGWDILNGVKRYELHPNFSEIVFKEAQEEEGLFALKLLQYSLAMVEDEEFLHKFYNFRESCNKPVVSHINLPLYEKMYKDNPDLWEELLSKRNSEKEIVWGDYELPRIYKLYQKNPEEVKELINITDRKKSHLYEGQIRNILTLEEESRRECINYLKSKDYNGARSRNFNMYITKIIEIIKKDPKYFSELANIKNFSGMYALKDVPEIEKYANVNDKKTQNIIIDMLNMEAPISKFINNPHLEEISQLLKEGVNTRSIQNALDNNKFEEFLPKALSKTSALKEFFSKPDYLDIIKKHTQGKYQNELMEFFSPEKMPYPLKSALFNSDLSVEDFLESLKKISKSSFKLAYDTPNQYIDNLDSSLSTPINGHYPKLSDEDLELQRQKIKDFFVHNITALAKGLKYIDTDTMNHLMDKRLIIFTNELEIIKNMPDKTLALFPQLSKCKSESTGKPISVKEKLEIYEFIKIFNSCGFDTTILEESIKNNSVNFAKIKETIYKEALKYLDINIDKIDQNKKFNENYIYLIPANSEFDSLSESERTTAEDYIESSIKTLRRKDEKSEKEKDNLLKELEEVCINRCTGKNLQTVLKFIHMLNNIDEYSDYELKKYYRNIYCIAMAIGRNDDEIQNLVKATTIGDFTEFINNPNNKYGQANIKTREIFKEKNLNFEQWLDPEVPDINFTVANRKLKIKLWDRNPYEDLFMGNKTSCCTAIGRSNGGATPIYIMSHCWNVVQMFDENGEVVGMSRVYIGEIDGEHSIMMDNIELNNKLIANMSKDDKIKIRNKFFEYMHSYGEKVTGKSEAKVYFYRGDTHVPTSDLKYFDSNVGFVGKNPTKEVYINSLHLSWGNPDKLNLRETKWFIVPKK